MVRDRSDRDIKELEAGAVSLLTLSGQGLITDSAQDRSSYQGRDNVFFPELASMEFFSDGLH